LSLVNVTRNREQDACGPVSIPEGPADFPWLIGTANVCGAGAVGTRQQNIILAPIGGLTAAIALPTGRTGSS
jgi:hypothetical protein